MQLDIEQVIDSAGLGPLHRRVLVLYALATLLDGYGIQARASATPSLTAAWHPAPGDLRWIITAALIGIAVSALSSSTTRAARASRHAAAMSDLPRSVETRVIVVGAGPVGLTLALDLARRGNRCVLMEQKPQPQFLPWSLQGPQFTSTVDRGFSA